MDLRDVGRHLREESELIDGGRRETERETEGREEPPEG